VVVNRRITRRAVRRQNVQRESDAQLISYVRQESPAVADKPARRESMPKIALIRRAYMYTTLSLTILVCLRSISCLSVRNLRNPAKFSENSNLYSSRSSKVIHFGANRKRICTFLLATNSNFGRVSYCFGDIDAFSSKIACFSHTSRVRRPIAAERHEIST